MKVIETNGITYIHPVPSGTEEWYYGISYEHGDLYEAEEIWKAGGEVEGRSFCLIHYPDGEVFRPLAKTRGAYCGEPVYLDGSVFIPQVVFTEDKIQIIRFDCGTRNTEIIHEMPLSGVKDCYNLGLDTAPLTLTRQSSGQGEFEILWPERVHMRMDPQECFFLRDGDRLYFNRWMEDETGFHESTVVRDLDGNTVESFPGDVRIMPNGELWHLK